jgi:hypothetical protein
MIKGLFGFLLSVVVLAVGGLYLAYGEVEPCKVLGVERERRADSAGLVEGTVDRITDGSTSGMSTTECISGLFDSWGERMNSD